MLKSVVNKIHLLIYSQLVVLTFSLPILVAWGTPISKVVILSNIFFIPIFTLFIILCSLMFFTELLSIPNGIIALNINTFVYHLDKLLNFGYKTWLIAFPSPGTTIVISMIFSTVFIMYKTKKCTLLRKTLFMAMLLTGYIVFLYSFPFFKKNTFINEPLYSIEQVSPYNIVFTDYGFFDRKYNIEKAVIFQLLPNIYKNFGKATIKEFYVQRPNRKTEQGVDILRKYVKVEKIFIDNKTS